MKKKIIIGGLVGLALYAAYRWNLERPDFPNGVPLGNIFGSGGALIAVAGGALAGYAAAL